MPKPSKASSILDPRAHDSMERLGSRLKQARLNRSWSIALVANKAGLSDSSVKKAEKGEANMSITCYLALFSLYGIPNGLDKVLQVGDDPIGESMQKARLLKTRGNSGQKQNDDEFDV